LALLLRYRYSDSSLVERSWFRSNASSPLKLSRKSLDESDPGTGELLDEGLEHTETATSALRELSPGIPLGSHARWPAGGCRIVGLQDVASRQASIEEERLAPGIEATAYFVVPPGEAPPWPSSRAFETGSPPSREA
jgi:hypothetical protein